MIKVEFKKIDETKIYILLQDVEYNRMFKIHENSARYVRVSETHLIRFWNGIELINLDTFKAKAIEYADNEKITLQNNIIEIK